MIVFALVEIVLTLLSIPLGAVDVLANSILPSNFIDSLSMFVGMSYVFSPILPLDLIYGLIATVLTFEITVMIFKVGTWMFDVIRQTIRG